MIKLSKLLALSFLVLQSVSASAATWYVAPTGSDSNPGTITSPFFTFDAAQLAASPGDTVYLRGGTYSLPATISSTTDHVSIYQDVFYMNKSGISYLAYPGELPVFDFTAFKPSGSRVTAFFVSASNCIFQGFDVVGVQVTIQTLHTQSECFRIQGGSSNIFQQLRMHDGMAIGFYLLEGSNNLILNCDAYNNAGLDGGSIGNTDGFGCHPELTTDTGNIFRGCRAWFNSDDGYDCINSQAVVTFDHCWSMYNGYYSNFTATGGDGNGFKAGGYGFPPGNVPNPVPHHIVENCLAVRNLANGFYANHHAAYDYWYDNTAYLNGNNYNMLEVQNTGSGYMNVPGYDEIMRNNLGYMGNAEVTNLNQTTSNVAYNYFSIPITPTSADFQSLDQSLIVGPRDATGNLPQTAFMQLTSGSACINAGQSVGFPYVGSAPDLGAFESGKPLLAWSLPVPIGTADTTLAQPGAVLGAACFGATTGTINVTLTNGNVLAFKGDGTVATCAGHGTFTGAYSGTTGNTNFNSVLNGAEDSISPPTITLKNLTVGTTYAVQIFGLDDRTSEQVREFNFQDPYDAYESSEIATMGDNVYTIGTFTAIGTTATILQDLPVQDAGNTNALVIYAISVPSPWVSQDIGSVGLPGSAGYIGTTFTLTGSGTDLYGTTDAFHYVSQPSSGDCSIIAKVLTVQNTNTEAKAGVMIRETSDAGSINAAVYITPDSHVRFSWRNTTGGTSSNSYVTGISAPNWVKLTRTGNSFAGYYSTNGTTWTQIGTAQTITMASSATIGLITCAHNNAVTCTGTLSNVTVTP